MAKTGGHYPAPLVAIDIVREGRKLPLRRALDLEAGAFAELVVSETAKNLISIFFAKNEVEARAAKIARAARPVGTVGVLGAGFMGAGIAQVLAQKGVPIVLKDRDLAAVGRGYGFARQQFRDRVKRRRATEAEAKAGPRRGSCPPSTTATLRRADFVIEAVFEDLEVKRAVLRETEAVAPAEPDLRLQHLGDPDRPPGRGEPPAGAGGGDALLQPGRQDAPARGHPPSRHLGGDAGDHRRGRGGRWGRR